MKEVIMNVLLTQITFIIILLGLIYFLIRLFSSVNYQKKFDKFSLTSSKNKSLSIFDKILVKFWKFIRKISKILLKSKLLVKYSMQYDKYITYEEQEDKDSLNYISLKLFLVFLFLLLNILTAILKIHKFSIVSFLFTIIISFFAPDIVLKIKFQSKRKRVNEDLYSAILIMNNSFKKGENILKSIEAVIRKMDGPIKDEFKKIHTDISYGLSLEIAFNRFYKRVKLSDAKILSNYLSLLSKSEGNMDAIFFVIEKTLYAKKEINDEVESIYISSKFVLKFLIFIPLLFLIVFYLVKKAYFEVLFTTNLGLILISIFIILYTMSILLFMKVLKVKIDE